MLEWSTEQREHPVMIVIPGNAVAHRAADSDFSSINKFKMEQKGEKTAILALGDFYQRGEALAAEIEKELGYKPTLINPRFASGLDKEMLEDGIVEGGFGQKVASYYGPSDMKVKNFGLKKEFYDRYDPEELLDEISMTPEQITSFLKSM